MRNEKYLINLLTKLVKLLNEESERNPSFALQLDALLSPIASKKLRPKEHKGKADLQNLPDIYREFSVLGQSEFGLWLRGVPTEVLHALIRHHDLDARRRTAKWKDPEKLIQFITEGIQSRVSRGAAFLTMKKIEGE